MNTNRVQLILHFLVNFALSVSWMFENKSFYLIKSFNYFLFPASTRLFFSSALMESIGAVLGAICWLCFFFETVDSNSKIWSY